MSSKTKRRKALAKAIKAGEGKYSSQHPLQPKPQVSTPAKPKKKKKYLPDLGAYYLRQYGLRKNYLPDFGAYYLREYGVTPLTVRLAKFYVMTSGSEAYINWNAGGYMATLIVPTEFAKELKGRATQAEQNDDESLDLPVIIPDPSDEYLSVSGEQVIPFKLFTGNQS